MASGYQVVEAENAMKALNVLNKMHPDMILMDINMPDMDGYTGDKERTLDAGCDGYIEKPIDVDRFIEQIERFLK
jgi:two-component system, cell cycle response regulator DivK